MFWYGSYQAPVQKLLAKHNHRIRIEWLPPYTPELNPQEDVWRHMWRRVTHNHYFEQMDDLLVALDDFHRDLVAHPEQLRSLLKAWYRRLST